MNGLEWVFSGVLAVVFLATGVSKAFFYERARTLFPWVSDVPRGLVQGIGIAEILGALGLILPVATGRSAWLTPVAALALGLLMFSAVMFHLRRRETDTAILDVLLLLFLLFVVYSRWTLMPLA